jgi:mRNA-capping enzyme
VKDEALLQERWAAIEECVVKPRRKERDLMDKDRQMGTQHYPARYDYRAELFSVRRKEFWPLPQVSSLLTSFIPNLSHESDGLIFQALFPLHCPGTNAASFL